MAWQPENNNADAVHYSLLYINMLISPTVAP